MEFRRKKICEKVSEKTVKIILLKTFHLGRSEEADFRVPQMLKMKLAEKLLRASQAVNNPM